MKKLTILKVSVDVLMTIIFFLLFNWTGPKVHEVLGVLVTILLSTHIALNFNWIKGVGKKIFSKDLPSKSRFEFIINILMLISILVSLISGIFISKSLFPFLRIGDTAFLTKVHISSSFVSLAFIGIHFGLRWNLIKAKLKKVLKITEVRKEYVYVSRVLVIFFLIFGLYSFYAENYISKVLMLEGSRNEMKFDGRNKDFKGYNGPKNQDSKDFRKNGPKNRQDENTPKFRNNEDKNVEQSKNESNKKGEDKISLNNQNDEKNSPKHKNEFTKKGEFKNPSKNQNSEGKYMGMKNGRGHGRNGSILNILGITSTFAIITVFLENLLKKRKAKKQSKL